MDFADVDSVWQATNGNRLFGNVGKLRLRWHCHFMQKLEDEPAIAELIAVNLRHNLRALLAPSPILAAGIFFLGFRTPVTLQLPSVGTLAAMAGREGRRFGRQSASYVCPVR